MKKVLLISATMIAVIAFFAFRQANTKVSEYNTINAGDKVEVYYFHLTRRCVTCQAVENETRNAIQALYPDEMEKGTVSYIVLNLEDEKSKPAIEKCKATGQSLLVISGDTRIDLTDKGFMYAKTSPEKLRSEIKKAIDPLLKMLQ
ncbi:MAG: nitrophenyl compound nitroreductase subunit ArsF family protein [Bacteroidales bacterium]|jgi:hypothetical protein|nr:nitrophenyl compound nitroreductase subunit ArsF family protein [Bacteroidales bacterium]